MAFVQTIAKPFVKRHAGKLTLAGVGLAWLHSQPRDRFTFTAHHKFPAQPKTNHAHRPLVRQAFADAAVVSKQQGAGSAGAGAMESGDSSDRKVVFAFDTTEASQYAFEWALNNFFVPNDMVLLLNVRSQREPPEEIETRMGSPITERQARLQEVERLDRIHYELSEARGKDFERACRAKGISCKSVHAMGNPAVRIVDVGAENDADCIVLGTHDRGALGRLTIGGVPTYVVHNAHCPVIVARPKKHGPVEHESPYEQEREMVEVPPISQRNRKGNSENVWRLIHDRQESSWGRRR